MSPFAPLFSHPTDRFITWVITLAAWACASGFLVGKLPGAPREPDRLLAVSIGFFRVCCATAAVFLVGVLIIGSKVFTSLLMFWQLAYLLAVVAVFQVLPWIGLALLIGSLVRVRTPAGSRGAAWVGGGYLLLGAGAALFFVIDRIAAS
jgi:hypothetical protein